ncbi:phiSA1p31-related protein [Streptomyces longispororuber]|uniref:phiSA1p31-related protein n=1 Tax=Streptomyces longispororuber TaxID=68230 RepID=UPI0036FEF1FA
MISIEASTLHRMLEQVSPHMDDPENYLPVISSIRLETRDGWLYAVASDRFTLAAARRPILDEGARHGHVPGHLVPALTAWLSAEAGLGSTVGLTLPGRAVDNTYQVLLTTSGHGSFEIEYDADAYAKYPDWRKHLRKALAAQPGVVDITGFTTEFLARWQQAATKLVAWQTGPREPVVFLDEDGHFAGLHMPFLHEESRHRAAADWIEATARRATVDGRTYDLDLTWEDAHGDPWTYSGEDCRDGTPLMVMDGIEDDPHPLDRLITQYGPLHAAA